MPPTIKKSKTRSRASLMLLREAYQKRTGSFTLPMTLQLKTTGGKFRRRVWDNEKSNKTTETSRVQHRDSSASTEERSGILYPEKEGLHF